MEAPQRYQIALVPSASQRFLRFKMALDRTMAGALGLIGAKLIADAR